MPNRVCLFIALIVGGIASSCNPPGSSLAAAGAAPSLDRMPVGPIPGPAVEERLATNPYDENKVALAEGRQLFVRFNCSGCHGGHAGGGMGPSLRDASWRYGHTDAHIFDSISQGRGQGMPAWGTKIPTDQIWKLVAYIQSLRTPMEPDKPEI